MTDEADPPDNCRTCLPYLRRRVLARRNLSSFASFASVSNSKSWGSRCLAVQRHVSHLYEAHCQFDSGHQLPAPRTSHSYRMGVSAARVKSLCTVPMVRALAAGQPLQNLSGIRFDRHFQEVVLKQSTSSPVAAACSGVHSRPLSHAGFAHSRVGPFLPDVGNRVAAGRAPSCR